MGAGGWSRLGCAALVVGCSSAQPVAPPVPPRPSPSARPVSQAPRIASSVPPGSQWAGAPAAQGEGAARPAGACFSDDGCPGKAAPLPACAADLQASELGRVAGELGGYLGQKVLISGRLFAQNDIGNELVQCVGCCGPRRTPLRLVPQHGQAPGLRLLEPNNPGAFACQADSSQLCCDFEMLASHGSAEARVAAFGKLVEQPGESPLLALEGPQLCSLEANVDPNTCSLHGNRFADGAVVPVRASCMQRLCEHGSWVWQGEPCAARPTVLQFQPGASELDADQRQLLEKTARSSLAQRSALALSAHSTPAEGAASAELSRKRLAFVKQALLAAGIVEARVRAQGASAKPADSATSPPRVELNISSK